MNISAFANIRNVKFVGLDNYAKLFDDADFWQALGNTGFFAVDRRAGDRRCCRSPSRCCSTAATSWFFRALRSFYFIPAITAIVAISLIWGYLYNTQFGFLNYLLSLVGMRPGAVAVRPA